MSVTNDQGEEEMKINESEGFGDGHCSIQEYKNVFARDKKKAEYPDDTNGESHEQGNRHNNEPTIDNGIGHHRLFCGWTTCWSSSVF